MKKVCKKVLDSKKVLLTVILGIFLQAFSACSTDSGSDPVVLYPNNGLAYELYPNDKAPNDSASVDLAHGVILEVHPNASYTLSFDKDPDFKAPKMQLFRLYLNKSGSYNANQVRNLKPKENGTRLEYTFVCEENKPSLWAVTLESNDDYYQGKTSNVQFVGEGSYSDHLTLNLIVVGNVPERLDGFTIEELAENLQSSYRRFYSSVIVDSLYVNYAHEHPSLGKHYPADKPWVARGEEMMMTNLGGWPGLEKALDIVLVHYIDEEGVMGYSNLFSGNLGAGEGSTVILGAYVKTQNGQAALSMSEIIETALHETGHFFGLRHTTSTSADIAALGDFSNIEDGLEDTPYCKPLVNRSLYKVGEGHHKTDIWVKRIPYYRIKLAAAGVAEFQISQCPDASNYMFPLETETSYVGFSEQQLDLLRKSLMIFPH